MRLSLDLPGARALNALCVGENSIDLLASVSRYPAPDDKVPLLALEELPGGEAASAAAALARLGWRTAYLGRFGDDGRGQVGLQSLHDEGVDTSHAIVVQGALSRLAIIVSSRERGQRSVLWQRDARLAIQPGDVSPALLGAAQVLLVGSADAGSMAATAAAARAVGTRTVGDLEHLEPDTPALLAALDVIITDATFPQSYTGRAGLGAALADISESTHASLVCATLGADGCLARVGRHELHVPAFRIEVVDTTGAGDLFRAGFISGWLRQPVRPAVRNLLRSGHAVAALGCRAVGARRAAPHVHEVEALLRE